MVGDFNARVGKNHTVWKNVLGKHGVGKMNENGLKLLQFCALEELTIMNTCFQQKDKYKNTWKHPRSQHWHMIDFIIVRSSKKESVKKCRVMRSAQCETDHYLVRAKIHLKPKFSLTKKQNPIHYNNRCLLNENASQLFRNRLNVNAANNDGDQNVEAVWSNIKNAIPNTAAETLEKKKTNFSDWFDESDNTIKSLLDEKRRLHNEYLRRPTKENEKQLKNSRRKCQGEIRKIRDEWWRNRAQQLQQYINVGDSYNLYKGIKAIVSPPKRSLAIIEDENGEKIKDQDLRLQRWSKYFDNLYNQEAEIDENIINLNIPECTENINDNPPNKSEIAAAIQRIKNNKSPGQDAITGEMLKAGKEQ